MALEAATRPFPGGDRREIPRTAPQEIWIISYADMMTNLFAFVLLLLILNSLNLLEQKALEGPTAREAAAAAQAVRQDEIAKLKTELEAVLEKNQLTEQIRLKTDPDGITLAIKDELLFALGQAEIAPQNQERLRPLLESLKALDPKYSFVIEGHTDDNPIHTLQFPSNWHLSAARAVAQLEVMRQSGFDQDLISIKAFGETRPVAPNRDASGTPIPENQAQNRRAVIRIIAPPAPPPS